MVLCRLPSWRSGNEFLSVKEDSIRLQNLYRIKFKFSTCDHLNDMQVAARVSWFGTYPTFIVIVETAKISCLHIR